jgi:hypothetical protein
MDRADVSSPSRCRSQSRRTQRSRAFVAASMSVHRNSNPASVSFVRCDPPTLEDELGLLLQDDHADLEQPPRRWDPDRHAHGPAQCGISFDCPRPGVRDVDRAGELLMFVDEPDCAERVVDMDPAEPLVPVSRRVSSPDRRPGSIGSDPAIATVREPAHPSCCGPPAPNRRPSPACSTPLRRRARSPSAARLVWSRADRRRRTPSPRPCAMSTENPSPMSPSSSVCGRSIA